MKLNYLSALMLTAAAVFCSCSISEIEPIEKPTEKEVTETVVGGPQKMMAQSDSDSLNFDQVKAFLDQMGYNTETLTEYDDYYLIYSDLLFPKSEIAKAIEQPVSLAHQLKSINFRLYINSNSLQYECSEAIILACRDWNNIGNCSINFASNASTSSSNYGNRHTVWLKFEKQFMDESNDVLKVIPKFTENGVFTIVDIYIDPNHFAWKNANTLQRAYLIEHAFGHIVGLDHAGAQTGSIMMDERGLYNLPNSYWTGLTSTDQSVIRDKYPLKTPVTGYTINPNMQADADKRIKLEFNQAYTVTPSYTYAWVTDPTFSYQVISGSAVITSSDKSFTIKLDKHGSCTVRITAKDAVGETNPDGMPYEFDLTFYTLDVPKFNYPTTINVGEYANYEVQFDPTGYKNVTYTMSGYETLFDNNTNSNVEIIQNGKSFKVKLKDYGRYKLTTKVTYDQHVSTFVYNVEKYARPVVSIYRFEAPVPNPYQLPSHSNPPKTPTGENRVYEDHTQITFGTSPVLQNRVVYNLSFYYLKWVMHFPGRPDKDSYYKYGKTSQRDNILRKGQSSVVDHVNYGMYHPDSINYVDHYTILHPETDMDYPADNLKIELEEHK